MAQGESKLHPGALLLAFLIALFLWGVAHGSSSIERGYDLPVVLRNVPDNLVVTDRSADVVNVRLMGSRAALGNVDSRKLEYGVDVSSVRPGRADFEVDVSRIDLPRGVRPVSRSPAQIEVYFERRASKAVRVRADVTGDPAPGFQVTSVEVLPSRVKLVGARSQVLSLKEVVTEPIDITGLSASDEREARIFLGSGTVWVEQNEPVKVRIGIGPEARPPGGAARPRGPGAGT
jgi:YbbR domain-containing protein